MQTLRAVRAQQQSLFDIGGARRAGDPVDGAWGIPAVGAKDRIAEVCYVLLEFLWAESIFQERAMIKPSRLTKDGLDCAGLFGVKAVAFKISCCAGRGE